MGYGVRAYWKAIRFLIEHRLYWYMLIPAVLMLIIYYLGSLVSNHHILPDVETTNDIVWYVFYLMIEISIALLLMKFAKYLVVVILSPLISHLSMKCEFILTGKSYPWNFKQLVSDVKRAMRIVIRNLMWEYFFFVIIYIVAAIGWDSPQTSPIFYMTFLIGFYYYGFAFLDYINERRRLTMDQSIMFVRKNRGLAIIIGAGYSIMILVPVDLSALFDFSSFETDFSAALGRFFLNLFLWLCASLAPILTILAATIVMHDLVDLSKNEHSQSEELEEG